jgi:hypothetical protein
MNESTSTVAAGTEASDDAINATVDALVYFTKPANPPAQVHIYPYRNRDSYEVSHADGVVQQRTTAAQEVIDADQLLISLSQQAWAADNREGVLGGVPWR